MHDSKLLTATSSGSDSAYIKNAREIQENIQLLSTTASHLPSVDHISVLHARLKEANTVAIETRGLLKAFGHATNASADYYDNERSLRRQAYKKLNAQYQAALKSLDKSAAQAAKLSGADHHLSDRSDSLSVRRSSTHTTFSTHRHSTLASYRQQEKPSTARVLCPQTTVRSKRLDEIFPGQTQSSVPLLEDSQKNSMFPVEKISRSSSYKSIDDQNKRSPYLLEMGYLHSVSPNEEIHHHPNQSSHHVHGYVPLHVGELTGSRESSSATKASTVLEIERDVRGIRDLYKEMAWQLNNNADDLDTIESQMRSAAGLCSRGFDQLSTAYELEARSRHRQLFLLVLGCGVLVVLVWFVFK